MPAAPAPRPEVVVIAALAERDRLIGDGLDLPWHLPPDLRRFKRLTTGHPLVMGRRTFEALVHQFGGPLPDRPNVVLSRAETLRLPGGAVHFRSLADALAAFADAPRVFIGGGAAVYAAALAGEPPLAHRLELTLVEGDFSGDTYFPPYAHLLAENGGPFAHVGTEAYAPEAGRPGYRFETYARPPAI
ncbi:MAG: dihydrofolate reductase [Rubricoccaceae bacterium]